MIQIEDILQQMDELGYEVDKRPFKLNIIGIRDKGISEPNNYEDNIAYFYYDNDGNLIGNVVEGTTTPSVFWLQDPMNPKGTAILKQGQYENAYSIGFHRGKYEALVQTKPVTVIRDSDRNSELNYFGKTDSGLFGINIHRSTPTFADKDEIGEDSAGCQVLRFREDFNQMMSWAKKSRDLYGNNFTYTLIDEREQIQNTRKKAINYGVIGAVLIGLSGYFYFLYKRGIILNK